MCCHRQRPQVCFACRQTDSHVSCDVRWPFQADAWQTIGLVIEWMEGVGLIVLYWLPIFLRWWCHEWLACQLALALGGLPWPDNALSWCHSWLAGAAHPGIRWCNASRSRWRIELSSNLGAISAGLRLSKQSIGTKLMPVRIFWRVWLVWPGFCITHWHHFCKKINEVIRAT